MSSGDVSRLRFARVAVPVVVVLALTTRPAAAFRTAGDLPDFDGQLVVALAKPSLAFELSGAVAPDLDDKLVQVDAERAIATWTAPGCASLTAAPLLVSDRDAQPGDGQSSIQWVSDWKARGFPEASPGATDVQYVKDRDGRWTISEADIYLNVSFEWTTGIPTDDRKSVQAVLTHELGHALGLLHPCELDGAEDAPLCSTSEGYQVTEMYPVYSPEQTSLADDDIAGVCFLYAPGCNATTCPEGTLCVGGVCQPTCGDATCSPDTTCVQDRCVANGCGADTCLGASCGRDADCALHEFCEAGHCARGRQPLGDVCQTARECADGACFEGSCAEACSENSSCRGGARCEDEARACVAQLAPMGAQCEFSTDCSGGYCAAEGADDAVCTRACGGNEPPCPSGWACRRTNGERVCAPETSPSSTCAFAPAPNSVSHLLELITTLGFVSWRAVRRRRSFPVSQ